ncbi:MAG: Holliday junction branch migration protein RuvA, partial [Clostridiales bacterium]|nr:Holliday junction branch migration protein RuvA [Clostridiales bacterium]
MIGFLRGAIEFKANNYILIDVGGVGYKVFMPAESIKNLEMNSSIK